MHVGRSFVALLVGEVVSLSSRSSALVQRLPHGRSLPSEVWAVRHKWVVSILLVQSACLPVLGLLRGYPIAHALAEGSVPAILGFGACLRRLGPLTRSALSGVGLMVVSSVVVHLSGGSIEAHFHFFVMVPVVALYESWVPFGLAISWVLVEHGLVGTLDSQAVYDHPAAQQRPWTWAAIHAMLFAAACVGSIVNWKLHEAGRELEKRLNDDLAHQARHDLLTGLPNRTLLLDAGEMAIAEAVLNDRPLSVLMIDLDRFKEVNDTLGHSWGDALLQQIGPRLRTQLRDRDVLVRLGGDEFAILLPGVASIMAQDIADRLHASIAPGFQVAGLTLDVEASMGIATLRSSTDFDHDDSAMTAIETPTIGDLLRQADVAMYAAKQTGCGTVAYAHGQDDNSRTRLTLLTELRQAIALDQLLLHYQPKVDVGSGAITGVEALVRWQHPERGLLPPSEFIPAAESTSLIHPLTERVLDLALAEARVWQDLGQPLQVAVNVSARSLHDTGLPGRVRGLLERHGIPGSLLRIEITETSLIADPDAALAILTELADQGVRLSIDDYGTGYSSMEYLRKLPVDELKVDRSFTAAMSGSESDAVIVRAAIDLGHNLGMRVVAEGVEDDATLRTLADASCDMAQGFHIAHPMPGAQFREWIRTAREVPTA